MSTPEDERREDPKERSRKMGSSPLSGRGPLDWIGEEDPPDAPPASSESPKPAKAQSSEAGEEASGRENSSVSEDAGDPGGEGLRPGFRRHTLIMREDHIEKVNRLVTLEKLRSGDKLKKDVVADIFDWYFREHSGVLSLDDVS